MEKVFTSSVKNYIQRNGFVMVSNLLFDYQQELGITESELLFIIKILKNKNNPIIHDRDLDPTVCSKTLSRKRNSLRDKGLLNFSTVKTQDAETGTFKTDGVSYDLSPLEEKLQIISDKIESERTKKLEENLSKENKIVESRDDSPLEKYKKDYLNYYGLEYVLNAYEIKKYNSSSDEEKNAVAYIFNYCSDNNLFGKIVPRLSLFFKTKFRFDSLMEYYKENIQIEEYEENKDRQNNLNERINEIYKEYYPTKENYAFYKAVERILSRFSYNGEKINEAVYRLIDKAYENTLKE